MMSLATNDRLVIVGASLAGLRAAEALREEGFSGHLTLIDQDAFHPPVCFVVLLTILASLIGLLLAVYFILTV